MEGGGGRAWRIRPPVEMAPGLAGLPPIVAQLLYSRGIVSQQGTDPYLNPQPHDPSLLSDMARTVDRITQAIANHETIGVFGDFDVDGVTATALVAEGLGDLGGKVVPYIPHREEEGHGLNDAAVQALRESGITLLITVDCGVTSHGEIALAQELGMDVIVTDHHVPPNPLPPALSVVDPKVEGSTYPFVELSGGGLAFKLIQAVYDRTGRDWSRDLLELVALSTVADLVPLVDENRYLVKEGLKELRRSKRPGLQALYRQARLRPDSIDTETISFYIAPRLNAAGRLDHAHLSYRLLLTRSEDEAVEMASRLESLNRERQQLTETACARARDTVSAMEPIPAVLLVGGDWVEPGIAGLVASRLVDEFSRPAIVMSLKDGVIRGSARVIPGYDCLEEALTPCGDLFTRFGGHTQAAGFEMAPERLPELEDRMEFVARKAADRILPEAILDIDAEVPLSSLPGETFRWIKEMEPFGMRNPAPCFLTRNLVPVEARFMGNKQQHLKLKLKETGGAVWDAVAFRQGERWIPNVPLVDVVYTIGTERRGATEVLALKVLDFQASGRLL